jgi:hypothetical protein
VVFNFLKKKSVRFEKDEEVEVLLLSRQDLFITRIARQSFGSVFLHLPPLARKKKLIEPDVPLIIHFTRHELLGSFRATVTEVLSDEHPPLFAIDIPTEISWEEIVPSRLVERSPACLSSAPRSLVVRHDGRETAGTFFCFDGETLTFHSPGDFTPGARVCIILDIEEEEIECEASVLHSAAAEDRGLFETAVSLPALPGDVKEYLKRIEPGKREE